MKTTTTTEVEITCTPPEGILAVSAETVSALDTLALTLRGTDWRINVHVDRTTDNPTVLSARPAHHQEASA